MKYGNTNKTLKKCKSRYISTTLDNDKTAPKRFWNEINNLLGAGKGGGNSIKMIKNDLGEILCDQNAADYLNDYYVNIGEVLAEKFGSNTWNPGANFPSQNMETFNFRIITEKESLSLIKQIDVSKSSAISEIKALFIKDAFLSLNFEVTYLLNESLRKGDFPDEWGHSFVTPIPKEGDHLEPGNWRPISQMPIIGR